ncbi:AAA family ATPase [Prescottella equi]|uniref:AAA family ATPase n=1 Tax=Rhodococcus hoagii TaxID=43767 RepID=UPI000A1058C0|nr:AAA family ATPase [Prescottella equi]ORL76417.1 hypothetical protein A5N71_16390 [Prescottella equi]
MTTTEDRFTPPRDEHNADHDPNPFENPEASKRALEASEEEHLRRNTFYSVADLAAQTTAPRARRAAQNIERNNLTRDVKYPPMLVVTGENLIRSHVPAEELPALDPLTHDQVVELKAEEKGQQRAAQYASLVQDRIQWKLADQEATKHVAAIDVADTALPPVVGLSDLLAEDDTETRYRIQDVFPSDGARILFAAPEKAGKTTLLGNLTRSLADGDPFLDRFEVHTTAKRIVIIDNEMSKGMLRRWMRRQGIRNMGAVADVVALRGQAGLFDLGDDRRRGEWAKRLRDLGCDFLIFDCLRPVLDALGLDENRETGKFLGPFDQLLAEAGVADAVIAHHMGHSSERARGDSRLVGWSDGNWKIVRDAPEDPASSKSFSALVRDSEPVPEGLLTFDPESNRLTYAGGSRAERKGRGTVDRRLEDVLRVLGDRHAEGVSWVTTTAVKDAVGGKKDIAAKALEEGLRLGLIEMEQKGAAKLYRLAAGDPLSAAAAKSPLQPENTD